MSFEEEIGKIRISTDALNNFYNTALSERDVALSNLQSANTKLNETQQLLAASNTRNVQLEAQIQALKVEIDSLNRQIWPKNPGVLTRGSSLAFDSAPVLNMRSARPDASAIRTSRVAFGDMAYVTATVPTDLSPSNGMAFVDDMTAAYCQGLLFLITKDSAWKARAERTLSAWLNLRSIIPDTARSDKLWAGWGISIGTRAVSLIGGHPIVNTFETIAGGRAAGWPIIDHPQGSNWLATHSEARLGLAVNIGDRAIFDREVERFRRIAPHVIWLASDGPLKVIPGMNLTQHLWGATVPTDGEPIELRRDLGHAMMGVAALANAAHTATLQGVDLLTEHRERFIRGYESLARECCRVLDGTRVLRSQDGVGWQAGWLPALSVYGAAQMPLSARVANTYNPSPKRLHMVFESATFTSRP